MVPVAQGTLLPNLLLAGVTHAGAVALSQALAAHPQVVRAAPRRVDHFTPLRYGKPVDAPLEDYDDHFDHARGERYRLETSPVYFDGGARLVGAVHASLPGARVVVLLRDPAERLWTGYLDKVARGRLPGSMTFDTFVERCLALRANRTDRFEGNRYYRTLSSGFYVEHLPGWLAAFGSRARLVFAEDLAADRAAGHDATVAGLLSWLDLPADSRPTTDSDGDGPRRPVPGSVPERRSMLARLWSAGPTGPATGPSVVTGAARLPDGAPLPRPRGRTLARVRALYAGPNRDLAAALRAHASTYTSIRHRTHAAPRDGRAGRRDLPAWLDA